jgi:phage FluMu protein Com
MNESRPHDEPDDVLDGNAVAGVLAELFGNEMTELPERCAHCGTVSLVAELRVYLKAPGTVLRCPACQGVVLRLVETDDALYVDARGAAYLRFERR